ncbi:MAG: YdcF family protein [Aulosira sp. DedQUE10]|nr:YdcF family protein [Aulosira sp. DedQUE10]
MPKFFLTSYFGEGIVKTIIFTGGVGESNEPAEAIVGKNYALAQQVKAADILTETQSRTTHQNLRNALEVANAHQLTKFLIISDPLYMKRALLMVRSLRMDAYSSPTPTTRYRSFYSQIEFLSRETYFYFVYLYRFFVKLHIFTPRLRRPPDALGGLQGGLDYVHFHTELVLVFKI